MKGTADVKAFGKSAEAGAQIKESGAGDPTSTGSPD
jgi:hypothetical protein